MTGRTVLLFVAMLSSGLAGGLLFGWYVSVIPGLTRVSDHTYISTMQSINREIINPAFVITFIVPPLTLGVAGLAQFWAGERRRGLSLGLAAVTYLIGVLGVTFGGNIPLNNTLDVFDLSSADVSAIAKQRGDYESAWNRWHAVRTLASVVAMGLAAGTALMGTESTVE